MRFTARLSVIAANIESVGSAGHPIGDRLIATIRDLEPDVVVVEQAYNARGWLGKIEGYRLRQYRGKEASDIAVLIRDGINLQARRALRMKLKWHGPDSKGGRQHPPRVYPALVVVKGGVAFRVLGIHFPTFNNPAAQAESADAVAEWFARQPAPSIAAGDWNREARELEELARRCGADVLSAQAKVDHALAKNVADSTKQKLPMPSGVHGWSRYTIEGSRET